MIVKDWIREAAEEITKDEQDDLLTEEAMEIIKKHCPFQEGVVYEPVTETSRKLDEIQKELKEQTTMLKFIRSAVR